MSCTSGAELGSPGPSQLKTVTGLCGVRVYQREKWVDLCFSTRCNDLGLGFLRSWWPQPAGRGDSGRAGVHHSQQLLFAAFSTPWLWFYTS